RDCADPDLFSLYPAVVGPGWYRYRCDCGELYRVVVAGSGLYCDRHLVQQLDDQPGGCLYRGGVCLYPVVQRVRGDQYAACFHGGSGLLYRDAGDRFPLPEHPPGRSGWGGNHICGESDRAFPVVNGETSGGGERRGTSFDGKGAGNTGGRTDSGGGGAGGGKPAVFASPL